MNTQTIYEKISEKQTGLLEMFIEEDKNWEIFQDWLFSKENNSLRHELLNKFAKSKQGQVFFEWAYDLVANEGEE